MIALNVEQRLSRAALCRLARELETWWPAARTASDGALKVLAARAGVPLTQLRRARAACCEAERHSDEEVRRAEKAGVEILTWLDDTYPACLRDLHLPPPVLYVRGAWPLADLEHTPALAVVGSRRASDYGREATRHLVGDIAARGVLVVSGFAVGVDAVAHEAALDAGGHTVAVLGCGVDVPYPKPHGRLRDKLLASGRGALLSEFPLGLQPRPWTFPVRNRVIAALGKGTLVVQAAAKSGSLITAHQALELGREVMAVPGGIFDPGAVGPNRLIRDGAVPVLETRDLLDLFGLTRRDADPGAGQRTLFDSKPETEAPLTASSPTTVPPPDGLAGELLQQLPAGSERSVDDLVATVERTVDAVLGALLELELAGWVERLPGQLYRRG